jgi:hypothetical protein
MHGERGAFWEPNSHSASLEIHRFLWILKTHYWIYNSPPLVPVLSQMNPAILSYSILTLGHRSTHIDRPMPKITLRIGGGEEWDIPAPPLSISHIHTYIHTLSQMLLCNTSRSIQSVRMKDIQNKKFISRKLIVVHVSCLCRRKGKL